MESRLDKYYTENSEQQNTLSPTRSSRNSRLYREVYGKYSNLDNLPLEDNTDEIDMEKLRELVLNTKPKKENQDLEQKLNILEQQKRKIDEQKIYDINKILEKAKYENNKLKEPTAVPSQINKNILSTLESTEISLLDIRSSEEAYEQRKKRLSQPLVILFQ